MTPTPHQPDSGIDIEALRIQVKMALDDPRTPYAAARFADACRALLDRLERAEGLVKMQREALDLVAEGQALRKKFDFAEAAAGAVPEVVSQALDIALGLAMSEADQLKQSLGERLPHKHRAAQDDIELIKGAIDAIAAPPAQGLPAAPENCSLRLCTKAGPHVEGCDTYDPTRYPDKWAIPPAAAPSEPVAWRQTCWGGETLRFTTTPPTEELAWEPLFATPPTQDAGTGDWISVDERLPSSATLADGITPTVLALWKRGALADNLSQVGTTNTIFLARNREKFTHWMPLPPLPAQSQTAGAAKGGIQDHKDATDGT